MSEAAWVPRPWRPAPLVAASFGVHGLALAGAIAVPLAWPWSLAAVAINHTVLGAVGLWPRSTLLGPNLTRLPAPAASRGEIALTFDDGPDPDVTPRVLDMLDAAGCRATFFCIARRARAHAALCREIARRGHAVENHSLGHSSAFAFLGLGGFRREVGLAQQEIAAITGRAPRFFRPPAGLRNPLLDPILHELELALVTWTRRGFDTREPRAPVVQRRLLHRLAAGDILLLHDGRSARSRSGHPVVLDVLPAVLAAARARGLRPVSLVEALAP